MQTLRTATNKEFEIAWDGVSTIDGAYRFAVLRSNISEAVSVFSNTTETEILTRIWNGSEKEYFGYTELIGINASENGEVVVSLKRSADERI